MGWSVVCTTVREEDNVRTHKTGPTDIWSYCCDQLTSLMARNRSHYARHDYNEFLTNRHLHSYGVFCNTRRPEKKDYYQIVNDPPLDFTIDIASAKDISQLRQWADDHITEWQV
jgi:hypothetical protein